MKRTQTYLLLLALANIFIHLLVYDNLEYHRDELLYFSLGNHPAVGYATVPPMIGWIAAFMQALFGYSLFAVKLFPALLSGAFVWLAAAITRELGGQAFAQILTGIAVLCMPITMRAFHLFQPVPLDFFFWTLLLYCTIRYFNSNRDYYLYAMGACFGIALLNKYLIALLFIALFLAFLLSPQQRRILKKKAFYIAGIIAFLLFLPNLIWQLNMGLPVINHMTELNTSQLVNVSRSAFLVDLMIMPFAVSLIMIPGFIYLLYKKDFRYLGLTTFFVIVALLVLRGKSYYAIGIFPLMLAGGTIWLEQSIRRNWLRWLIPLFLIMMTWGVVPFGIPIYKTDGLIAYFQDLENDYGLLLGRRFEDGTIHSLPQDYADQIGWEELTLVVKKAYEQVTEKDKCIIFAENYGQAGAVSVIGKQYGLPEAVSFHGSFRYWVPNQFEPDIESFIYINDELGEDVAALFENIKEVGRIESPHAREYGATVYLCTQPKRSFNSFWAEVVAYYEGRVRY